MRGDGTHDRSRGVRVGIWNRNSSRARNAFATSEKTEELGVDLFSIEHELAEISFHDVRWNIFSGDAVLTFADQIKRRVAGNP